MKDYRQKWANSQAQLREEMAHTLALMTWLRANVGKVLVKRATEGARALHHTALASVTTALRDKRDPDSLLAVKRLEDGVLARERKTLAALVEAARSVGVSEEYLARINLSFLATEDDDE